MKRLTVWSRNTVLCLFLLCWIDPTAVFAQEPTIRVAGVVTEERLKPLLQALAARMPGAKLSYERLSSAQIAAAAKQPVNAPFDIALLSSPDIAVSVANEGYAASDEAGGAVAASQWRNEVFGFWSDPAVMVLRRDAFAGRMPRTRIELVRALEKNSSQLSRRIGIVNIGIDDVSYLLASQDSIRTSLYWRLMRAFGGAKARIYDTTDDLMEALHAGDLDVLYNVPLSALPVGGSMPEGMVIIAPQDYVLAVPWVVLIPKGAANPRDARVALRALLSPVSKPALSEVGFNYPEGFAGFENLQSIELGPELLVFRDTIKRSKLLDMWFQMVVD